MHSDILKVLNVDSKPADAKFTWENGPVSMAEWWQKVNSSRSIDQWKRIAQKLNLMTWPLIEQTTDKYRFIFFVLAGLNNNLTAVRENADGMLPCVRDLLASFETEPNLDSHASCFRRSAALS